MINLPVNRFLISFQL